MTSGHSSLTYQETVAFRKLRSPQGEAIHVFGKLIGRNWLDGRESIETLMEKRTYHRPWYEAKKLKVMKSYDQFKQRLRGSGPFGSRKWCWFSYLLYWPGLAVLGTDLWPFHPCHMTHVSPQVEFCIACLIPATPKFSASYHLGNKCLTPHTEIQALWLFARHTDRMVPLSRSKHSLALRTPSLSSVPTDFAKLHYYCPYNHYYNHYWCYHHFCHYHHYWHYHQTLEFKTWYLCSMFCGKSPPASIVSVQAPVSLLL